MLIGAFASPDCALLRRLLRMIGHPPIRLAFPSGASAQPPGVDPIATVTFRDRRTLLPLILDPENAFAAAYCRGAVHIEGDLGTLLETLYRAMRDRPKAAVPVRILRRLGHWTHANTLSASRRNIHRHYDLGNDFYERWLDRDLVYTCAYFPSRNATLEEAQAAKLAHVCRKVRIQPGDTVIEAGCGWGSFALHVARTYGARVRAYNISREQIRYARRRAHAERLDHLIDFIEDDYRNIEGHADVFVSIGMLEHVGTRNYRALGDVIHRTIGDTGRGLLHFIGRNRPEPLNPWINNRIFPGAYTPTLRESMRVLEDHDFSVLDVENLRPHYAITLEHWLQRYEQSFDETAARFGQEFALAWRLYLAGSAAAFHAGSLQLFQVLFSGRNCATIPWTRDWLYHPESICTPVTQ